MPGARPWGGVTISGRLAGALLLGCVSSVQIAAAFPASDAASPPIVIDIPEPTEADLRHQLQLHNDFGTWGGPVPEGWTVVPRVTLQEIYTDNVLNTETDRRWDLITLLTPGIAVTGNRPNAQVRLSYAPQFRLDARTPHENNITQQLLGTGNFTIIQDELFLDMRAFAGSAPIGGGFGALGLGASPTFGSSINGLGTAGLAKKNQVQSSSLAIAPYWMHRFSDTGTAKIGYQFSQSSFTQGNGFVPLFFPTGNNDQYSTANEWIAQFETGERFAPFRNLTLLDAWLGGGTGVNRDSSQYTVLNRLGYLIDEGLTIFGEIGYERLRFGGTPKTRIDDVIWAIGTTITPNPDSQITVSFGHRYGENAFALNAVYALSARTRIAASYTTGLQSDLQTIQSQLDLLALDSTGMSVNSRNGAPLFIGLGGLGVQSGLFRTRRFTLTSTTTLDRDQFSVALQLSRNETIATAPPNEVVPFGIPAPPVGTTSRATTAFAAWVHQLNEVLLMSAAASYSNTSIGGGGHQQSVGASLAMLYAISETVTVQARYIYFNRMTSTPGQSFYQNLVLVGISKQF